MESLSLTSPHDFHHRRHGKSPHHLHKHLRTVTDNGVHMYGQGRKHGHRHGGHHMRRGKGEGDGLLSDGEKNGRQWNERTGRDACHCCDKRHGEHDGHLGREHSPVLHVPEETAGQNDVLTVVKETADEKVAVNLVEGATEPAVPVETDYRYGCHRGHGRHGFHGGKDKRFFERDGGHGKHKFGKEHKRVKGHKHDKSHKHGKRNAPLDVIMSTDAYTLTMDAPGAKIGDVSVTNKDGILTIRIERKMPGEETEGERVLVRERMVGSRIRRVALQKDAGLEAATSDIAEGVLTVTVPRRTSAGW